MILPVSLIGLNLFFNECKSALSLLVQHQVDNIKSDLAFKPTHWHVFFVSSSTTTKNGSEHIRTGRLKRSNVINDDCVFSPIRPGTIRSRPNLALSHHSSPGIGVPASHLSQSKQFFGRIAANPICLGRAQASRSAKGSAVKCSGNNRGSDSSRGPRSREQLTSSIPRRMQTPGTNILVLKSRSYAHQKQT